MRMVPEKPWFLLVSAAALIAGALFLSSLVQSGSDQKSFLCSLTSYSSIAPPLSVELSNTILHYATSKITPQQSKDEIRVSLDVLFSRRPCNFLVFGLGFDSQMWYAFNPKGTTIFLEEDPTWVKTVLKDASFLNAKHVKYSTMLSQATDLLKKYRSEPSCLPKNAFVKGNKKCRLALADLPEEVYAKEWDLIMVDAPRGYYATAPGRMAAIWTAAVMARRRKGEGHTDVFLHDVNRKVEKEFALEFLCKKYLVKGVGRLWHFKIPAVRGNDTADRFC